MLVDVREQIALSAADLEVGQTVYTACPACGAPGKASITRERLGLLYHCFKDSCELRGFLAQDRVSRVKRQVRRFEPRPYQHPTRPLSQGDLQWFRRRFELSPEEVTSRGQFLATTYDKGQVYLYPVLTPEGYTAGHMLRRYNGAVPKALAYRTAATPWQAWYVHDGFERILLVEDQISAVKASRHVTTVALLGTELHPDSAAQISALAEGQVVIALDRDATKSAWKLRRRWGLLFPRCTVLPLPADLKDLPGDQVEDLIDNAFTSPKEMP